MYGRKHYRFLCLNHEGVTDDLKDRVRELAEVAGLDGIHLHPPRFHPPANAAISSASKHSHDTGHSPVASVSQWTFLGFARFPRHDTNRTLRPSVSQQPFSSFARFPHHDTDRTLLSSVSQWAFPGFARFPRHDTDRTLRPSVSQQAFPGFARFPRHDTDRTLRPSVSRRDVSRSLLDTDDGTPMVPPDEQPPSSASSGSAGRTTSFVGLERFHRTEIPLVR